MNPDTPLEMVEAKLMNDSHRTFWNFIATLLLGVAMVVEIAPARAQPPIVLRDLTVIREQAIVDFDARAIQLADGNELSWDQVLSAVVSPERQAKFDEYKTQIGLPLFRLKYRASQQDWSGIGELAEPLYHQLKASGLAIEGDSSTCYLICIATMKARIHSQDYAGAVLPFLQAAKLQREHPATGIENTIDQETVFRLLPAADVESMLSSEILPIWFDKDQAKQACETLANSFVPTSAATETGAIVYLTSLAIETERLELARELMALLENPDELATPWQIVLRAQLEIATGHPDKAAELLAAESQKLSEATQAMGWYLKAAPCFAPVDPAGHVPVVELNDDVTNQAILDLLKIPAIFGQQYPALAAAAIYQAANIVATQGQTSEYEILRQELMLRYPDSYQARLLAK